MINGEGPSAVAGDPACALRLSEAAALLDGTVSGPDVAFARVSTDTRVLEPGELFVALRGPRFDGHEFIPAAEKGGACGALVERHVTGGLPFLRVQDTRIALGRLAAERRVRLGLPVVAITGSSGKTTVKEMTAAILARRGPVLATRGNLNNEIGMPLTLLELQSSHQYAVIELGANHAGEISRMTAVACPDVAVITNAGPAHLEGFGDLAGVACAKGEIFEALGSGGTAVINGDDPFAGFWRGLLGARPTVAFSLEGAGEVTGRVLEGEAGTGELFVLEAPIGSVEVRLSLPGRHNIANALAAATAAYTLGSTLEEIRAGLESVQGLGARLRTIAGPSGCRLIDDSYNANPASVAAAIHVLAALSGERVLVLGDMAELGGEAGDLHRQVGAAARAAGIDRLYALGELSPASVAAFGRGGQHFATALELAEALVPALHPGMTVLVKGSRSMRMEQVVAALLAAHGGG